MEAASKVIVNDYSELLKAHNLDYKPADLYYYQIGELYRVQGWMLHVSTARFAIRELISLIIPELIKEDVAFKVIYCNEAATMLMNGELGYAHIGKAIRIYPDNDEQALSLAERLIELTSTLRGPAVPSDIYLGGTVYARYGSFNAALRPNTYGQMERYYYAENTRLVKDECPVPFTMPDGIAWPFGSLAPSVPFKVHNIGSVIGVEYQVVKVLKADSKGSVFKTTRASDLLLQHYLVKEGKHGMIIDRAGRDVQERLRWQYQLQLDLQDMLPVPRVYDLYEENRNTYLVMEYVSGESLTGRVRRVFNGITWMDLDKATKLKLISYVQRLIEYLQVLHSYGYIHRDLVPDNFLFDDRDRLVMIDLELAYNVPNAYPSPPFALGTDGYMSPEQAKTETPTEKEDTYALGAMMICVLTSFSPRGSGLGHPANLEETLRFFICDDEVSALIARCLSTDPLDRPELTVIKEKVDAFHKRVSTLHGEALVSGKEMQSPMLEIRRVIQHGINAFNTSTLAGDENLWFSNSVGVNRLVVNEQFGKVYYCGMAAGIGGVNYILARARKLRVDLTELLPTLENNYRYVEHVFLKNIQNAPAGLYYGCYGFAMALCESIRSQFIEEDSNGLIRGHIDACLKLPCNGIDIESGAAGLGLALLNYLSIFASDEMEELLQKTIDSILAQQLSDGSWVVKDAGGGFSHGVTGIVLFLLHCNHRRADRNLEQAIDRSLIWLVNAYKRTTFASKNQLDNSSLHEGDLGIALCFIYAFEYFKNPSYQKVAVEILLTRPEHPIVRNLGLLNGLAGLGEVYLDAYRVFRDERWCKRAEWIVHIISRTVLYESDASCYWHTKGETPTVDMSTGSGGPLHFLIRYEMKKEFSFPMT